MSSNNNNESTDKFASKDIQNKLLQLSEENILLKNTVKTMQDQVDKIKREQVIYLQNVSHQLVAPLNAMKWHIENLTAGRIKTSDRIQKVLRSLYSQATIAVHLAKNFALMSNLEADITLSAQREPLELVDLKRLMVNLADDFQPLGWEKRVHIVVDDYPLSDSPPVLAIKNLISQVFSNIIENAVKYSTPDTEIDIFGQYNPNDDTVSVNVANYGIPLPTEEIGRVFERGYRSENAKNVYPAGTGFGLYIADKIIAIHEGKITAHSDKGGLTIFQVKLSVKGLQGKTIQRDAKDSSNRR